MKTLSLLAILILVSACSSARPVARAEAPQVMKEDPNWKLLSDSCLQKKVAVDCAKYAYNVKKIAPNMAVFFYKKGCALGNETACFNLKEIESTATQTNMGLLENRKTELYNCYKHYAIDWREHSMLDSFGIDPNKEETKTIEVRVDLEKKGAVEAIAVEGHKLGDKAVMCMKTALSTLHFIGGETGQILTLSLLVPKA